MSSTIRRPGARAARLGLVAAPFAGLSLAVLVVWQSSYSAFSAQTSQPGNSWQAGSVALTDSDPANSARFNVSGMKPGDTGTQCIAVTSSGTVPTSVRFYGANRTTPVNNLAPYLDLQVTMGTGGGGSGGSCTGFTASGAAGDVYAGTLAGFTADEWAEGHGTWNPSGSAPESRTYRITYTFSTSATDAQQNGSAGIDFVWEAQS